MLEIPESYTVARQIKETLLKRRIKEVIANSSEHKFAWFYKDPKDYPNRLRGKIVDDAKAYGGHVEIDCEDTKIVFSDGVNIRYYEHSSEVTDKHQLLLEFEDHTFLCASVQMYGGLWVFPESESLNPYYQIAKECPSPLSKGFTKEYFMSIYDNFSEKSQSVKIFLATKQRIPGLGNGVLQDILFNAQIHPKRKMNTLTDAEFDSLYRSILNTLKTMADLGGRDTEKDLFGNCGTYKTIMAAKNKDKPCPICQTPIIKEQYLGGSVYYCEKCQK